MCFLLNTAETIPQKKVLSSLRLFGEQVIPEFTKRERAEAALVAVAARKDEAAKRAAGAPMPT